MHLREGKSEQCADLLVWANMTHLELTPLKVGFFRKNCQANLRFQISFTLEVSLRSARP